MFNYSDTRNCPIRRHTSTTLGVYAVSRGSLKSNSNLSIALMDYVQFDDYISVVQQFCFSASRKITFNLRARARVCDVYSEMFLFIVPIVFTNLLGETNRLQRPFQQMNDFHWFGSLSSSAHEQRFRPHRIGSRREIELIRNC